MRTSRSRLLLLLLLLVAPALLFLLAGAYVAEARVGASTGCSVVAVRRGDAVTVSFPDDFRIHDGDRIFLAAPQEGLLRFREQFPRA